MATAKFDDGLTSNPKIIAAGPIASWLWFSSVLYCRRGLTDGLVLRIVVPSLVIGLKSPMAYAAKLVEVGLWDSEGQDFRVHDFLAWNPSKAQIEGYRANDRERKQARHSRRTATTVPAGIQTESEPESERIPAQEAVTTHARAKSVSVSVSEDLSSEILISEESARETTIAPAWRRASGATAGPLVGDARPHLRHAWCSDRGLCVPDFVHREFMGKLGRATAHDELRAWYPRALVPFEGQPVGEDNVRFWRNLFGHWVGTVTSPPTGGGKAAETVTAVQRMVLRRQAEREGRPA